MNYELAKELKDAGFPQASPKGSIAIRIPTLEEIIDACGRADFKLRQTYSAYELKKFYVIEIPGADDMERCDTPTESVARLWLALNKKHD